MIIGQLHSQQSNTVLHSAASGSALYNFFLASRQTDLSYLGIINSAYSTPARYLLELVIRMREKHPNGRIHVVNPLYSLNHLYLLKLVKYLQDDCPKLGNYIVADADDRPLCYVFDSSFKGFNINLVSTVNAGLDAKLLSIFIRERVGVRNVLWHLGSAICFNRLYTSANLDIYIWLAKQALEQLGKLTANSLPLVAVMPYHAGDAIFFSLAAVRTKGPIEGVVVCNEYIDIIRQHAPHLTCVGIDLSPPHRKGWEIGEEEYFLKHLNTHLPESHLYVYLRPSGDYNRTTFHLIDHFSFALGSSPRQMDDLVWLSSKSNASTGKLSTGTRILLHFDAGWALKIYPESEQKVLIEMLLERGFVVTVLSKGDKMQVGYREVAFRNYTQLLELLTQVDFVVGMDSFPAHLAAHSFALPTVCLFSSTRPANSNAPFSSRYVHLENGLTCRPCYATTKCPRFGGEVCKNFVAPDLVIKNIEGMLSGELPDSPQMDYSYPAEILDVSTKSLDKPHTINLKSINRAILLEQLNPRHQFDYVSQLFAEFTLALRRQGARKATYKSFRFIFRLISRLTQRKP